VEQGFLDILFFDQEAILDRGLKIPHPEMIHRRFVLEPLKEIAPLLEYPDSNQTIEDLAKKIEKESYIEKMKV